MKNTLRLLILSTSLFSITTFATTDNAGATVNWGYKGKTSPAHWANLDPDFATCNNGTSQSPIDIPDNVLRAASTLTTNYHSAPMIIMNDGTSTLMLGKTQTVINEGHGLQVNFPSNTKESISFNGNTYQLIQFHIHTPAENTLDGKAYPLEIHFVHQGPNGTVAVIAIFAKVGPTNPTLATILNNLPSKKGVATPVQGQSIDPEALLPKTHDYYNFIGSLTTPPCTEGLEWIVMPTPITASAQQLAALKQAIGGANARPIQPLNDRSVSYSIVGN